MKSRDSKFLKKKPFENFFMAQNVIRNWEWNKWKKVAQKIYKAPWNKKRRKSRSQEIQEPNWTRWIWKRVPYEYYVLRLRVCYAAWLVLFGLSCYEWGGAPRTWAPYVRPPAPCPLCCSTARSGRAAAREPPLGLVETEDQQPAALVEILRD